MSNKSALVLLSGGMDSTVLVSELVSQFGAINVEACSFDYGQRHDKELAAARNVALHFGIPHTLFDLRKTFEPIIEASGSSLLKKAEIPDGMYDENSMKSTVVPNRNMIMASVTAGLAEALHVGSIALATHAGDHAIYPDCRPEFITALRQAILAATDRKVTVLAPFIRQSKGDIVRFGLEKGAPFHLTWSCYKGQKYPCGKCGTCTERLEAFTVNRTMDPVLPEKLDTIVESLRLLLVNEKISPADFDWAVKTYTLAEATRI